VYHGTRAFDPSNTGDIIDEEAGKRPEFNFQLAKLSDLNSMHQITRPGEKLGQSYNPSRRTSTVPAPPVRRGSAFGTAIEMKSLELSNLNNSKIRPEEEYDPAYDISLPSFSTEKYNFLLFSKGPFNEKEFKKFLLEIKADVIMVREIEVKQDPPSKVVLVDFNSSTSVFM